jgi:hypothetical protein
MLNPKPHKLSSLELKGVITQSQSPLDRLGVVELDVGDSFAPSASGVSNDADISYFAAVRLKEEVPDVPLLGLQRQTIDQNGEVFSLCLLHLFF